MLRLYRKKRKRRTMAPFSSESVRVAAHAAMQLAHYDAGCSG
ncbi:hypothetical protein BURMUCF1_2767 [Burkholderia multivorans ATCC BAA-247]|uniref:Uncharacterized protein n=1 Tax=Burkholderia multivorans CGD2 TaxID=513052 RepID=B9BTU5_9BURK|nr:hypothetical protein BURMUCGD2_0722 [Burkholderia multivorans CGD2]EEE12717.1 hypothetical protein BURMUCGD2M_0813 [Burkholderia multivorans CGD2M]EJO56146.1 hypothetical protein BURMUCF1_2767 [Burkholderia multivorans ATCC BAA-247]